jgi:hypothetical protein
MAEQANPSEAKPSLQTCRLEPAGSKVAIRGSRYAIVGVYADGEPSFVRHAALLKNRCDLDATTPVDVWHIGPPIVTGFETAQQHPEMTKVRLDVIGDLVLSENECEAITDWRAGVEKERRGIHLKPFEQYKILPHVDRDPSEEGRRGPRRFSCAGYVIEAYDAAGIKLLDLDQLPLADETHLKNAYSGLLEMESKPKRVQDRLGFKGRADLGLTTPGKWPIALPGYLFHSTLRATDATPRLGPYSPNGIHEVCFPAGPQS